MVLAFEGADHDLGPWMKRALECCADHGGTPEAAAKTIFSQNILGGMCARVCPTEQLCAMLDDHAITERLNDLPPEAWALIKKHRMFSMCLARLPRPPVAVKPQGEAWSNVRLAQELARRMGLTDEVFRLPPDKIFPKFFEGATGVVAGHAGGRRLRCARQRAAAAACCDPDCRRLRVADPQAPGRWNGAALALRRGRAGLQRVDRRDVCDRPRDHAIGRAGGAPRVGLGHRRLAIIDLATGAQLWECAGLTDNVVSSPVFGNGLLITGNVQIDRTDLERPGNVAVMMSSPLVP